MKHLTQEHEEQDRYRREFVTANVSHRNEDAPHLYLRICRDHPGTAWYGPRMCPGLQGTFIRKPCGSSPPGGGYH